MSSSSSLSVAAGASAPPPMRAGVKGSACYVSTGTVLSDLNLQLNRGCQASVIDDAVRRIVAGGQVGEIEDLIVMAFQTRDIRGGKGERDLFYAFVEAFHSHFPAEVPAALVDLIPEFGCWRDLVVMGGKEGCSAPFRRRICDVMVAQLHKDEAALAASADSTAPAAPPAVAAAGGAGISSSAEASAAAAASAASAALPAAPAVAEAFAAAAAFAASAAPPAAPAAAAPPKARLSLLSKWLPREHSNIAADKKLALSLATILAPASAAPAAEYRKRVSKLNKALGTLEVTLCGGGPWADIKPGAVPGRALKLYRCAFLNTAVKGEHGRKEPSADPDRVACAASFAAHFAAAVRGEKKVHGANTVFPHELVAAVREGRAASQEETHAIEAQWISIADSVRAAGMLNNVLPMVDVSGSMDGTPMNVAIALGLLIAEASVGPFKGHVLTFDSNPRLHRLVAASFVDRVREVAALPWGGSTDFQAAYNLILTHLREQSTPAGSEPKDLIVLTDMGFDQACPGGGALSAYTGHSYDAAVSTSPTETHLQIIRRSFAAGGWAVPRIVVWNLRAEYKDFHATANERGVLDLSGWSSSMLRILITKGINAMTPLAMLQAMLEDPRYDIVRDRVRPLLSPKTSSAATSSDGAATSGGAGAGALAAAAAVDPSSSAPPIHSASTAAAASASSAPASTATADGATLTASTV